MARIGTRKKDREAAEENARIVNRTKNALLKNAFTPHLAESPKYIEVDDQFCSVLTINDFRSEVGVGWLDSLLQEPNMPVTIRLEPASTAEIKDSVDMHTKQTNEGLLGSHKTASQINDLEREQRHGLEILDIMGDANEKFFMATVTAVVRSESPETLSNDVSYLRSAIEGDGMRFKSINWNHLTGLLAASPLRLPDPDGMAQCARPFPASTVAFSLFNQESGLDDGCGLNLGQDDARGIVRINTAQRTPLRHNSNIVILGGSGSGKSTLAKDIVLQEHVHYGSRMIILDPEGEFNHLVRALGGEVVAIGSTSAAKISPLQPRAIVADTDKETGAGDDADDTSDVADELVLQSTIPFAKNFMSLAFGIKREQLDLLEVGLMHAYAKYGITKDTTFAEYEKKGLTYPIMSDVYDSLITCSEKLDPIYSAEFKRLALALRSAALGINADMWNTRSTFSLSNDIVSFDLLGLPDDDKLKAAWYYNILTYTWSEVRRAPQDGKPIRVVIDEAHNCVNPRFPYVADDIKSLVKRIRKRTAGGTLIISQEINDFLDPAIRLQGAAILNNATYKFIGQSEAQNLVEIAELYHLPEELVNRIKKAAKGNFACFAGSTDKVWLEVIIEDWMAEMFGTAGGR